MQPSPRRLRRVTVPVVTAAALLLSGGCDDEPLEPGRTHAFQSSFETSLDDWSVDATDIHVGGEVIDWSAERSTERASHGSTSVRIHMDNRTDAAKVWLERAFDVGEPNRAVRLVLTYDLASADWGDTNLFRLIAGGLRTDPQVTEDLETIFRGDTGNAGSGDVGYVWLTKTVDQIVTSGPDGMVHVVVGIWGTWETPRTYFIDNVRVTLTPLGT